MNLQKMRLDKGWSQEQLADIAGLSVRTIQRLEKGKPAGLESLKCLAAVLETDIKTLTRDQIEMPRQDTTQTTPDPILARRQDEAIVYVENLKGVYVHLAIFAFCMPALYVLNLIISPDDLWILYVLAAWLVGLALHLLTFFVMFHGLNTDWENRTIKRRLKE